MALSAIYLLNWFYSFSRMPLICFCNWKKQKKQTNLFKKYRSIWPDPTRNLIDPFKNDPFWPTNQIDSTRPTHFATSRYAYAYLGFRVRFSRQNILQAKDSQDWAINQLRASEWYRHRETGTRVVRGTK